MNRRGRLLQVTPIIGDTQKNCKGETHSNKTNKRTKKRAISSESLRAKGVAVFADRT